MATSAAPANGDGTDPGTGDPGTGDPSSGDPSTGDPSADDPRSGEHRGTAVTRESSAKALLVVAIGGGLYAFWMGWDLGAFQILVGYKRIFGFTIVSLVALVVSFVHPTSLNVSWRMRVMLVLPVLTMILLLALPENDFLLFALIPMAGVVLTLPFTLVALARMLDLDFFRLGRRDQWVAAGLVVSCLLLGWVGGRDHPRLVTCQEFAHHGDWVPPGCLDAASDDIVP